MMVRKINNVDQWHEPQRNELVLFRLFSRSPWFENYVIRWFVVRLLSVQIRTIVTLCKVIVVCCGLCMCVRVVWRL